MKKVLPKGHTSILASSFRYVPACRTNIAETFARIRKDLAIPPDRTSEMIAAEVVEEQRRKVKRFPR